VSVNAHVRLARIEDRSCLLDIWERAVRSTHAFLDERDIVDLRPVVAEELASDAIDWWVLECGTGVPIGFLGFAGRAIEGLFVDPDHHRRGVGKQLVAHAPKPDFLSIGRRSQRAERTCAVVLRRAWIRGH
jgi:putative acetyltransferase